MQSYLGRSTPTPRWYGNATVPYTPLGSTSIPRCGGKNDTTDIAPGIIGVILQDGTVVQVNIEDYNLLRASGWTGRWTARWVTGDNQYPSINHGDRIRVIARVILDARKGETVKYRNGDRNDLTRGNLILKAKGGIKIGSSNRVCPAAPILGSAERNRKFAAISAAVGTVSLCDRFAAAQNAVEQAQPYVHAARQAMSGRLA
ncbi:hypothetical protein [Rhodoferax sp.]|uniref:hypothetical protein n=1 Tax=Rhodoferax sp. TaxID=50421 RepID=UPI002601F839|nr:hypothetical protein [Rhodoferax sp.]MDD3937974.1 hypothetical protein [Rhodoferax sp.]